MSGRQAGERAESFWFLHAVRGQLKARAYVERERIVSAAVNGAIRDPKLALRLMTPS